MLWLKLTNYSLNIFHQESGGGGYTFSALTLLGIRKSTRPVKTEWCVGIVVCLAQGADCLHICLHLLFADATVIFKFRLFLPFWYQLTQVVLEKRPLNGCSSRVVDEEKDEASSLVGVIALL